MLEDKTQEFDQMVRSALYDAVEDAPSGAWEAIAAGLDKVATPAPLKRDFSPTWSKIIAGLAAAAAIAAAVLLPSIRNHNPRLNTIATIEETTTTPSQPEISVQVEDEVFTPEDAVATRTARRSTDFVASRVAPMPETLTIVSADEQVAETKDALEVTEAEEGSVPAAAPMGETEDIRTAGVGNVQMQKEEVAPSGEPFAQWEEEDKSTGVVEGLSLTFGGNVQSNGDPSGYGIVSIYRAPGTAQNVQELRETGQKNSYAVPLTFEVGLRYQFAPRFAVGAGISYTYLQRTFDGTYREVKDGVTTYNLGGDIRHTMHYIGLPVNLYFDAVRSDYFRLFLYAGGSVEKAIANKYAIPTGGEAVFYNPAVNGLQYSVGGGAGVQFDIFPTFGVYIAPSVRYFMGEQPASIRTKQPLTFSIEAGLRFNLGNK